MTPSYLEHYSSSLESLLGEIRRNFTRMYNIDDKNLNILRNVDAASDAYLRKVHGLTLEDSKVEVEKIRRMFKKAEDYGEEKVSIAIQTYQIVDRHIRRLDGDLAKIESEMKAKGRLSRPETESKNDNSLL